MKYDISHELQTSMRKLKKKNPETYRAIKRKILKIVNSDLEHYKPLKYGMKKLKRVHVMSSFVLVFEHDKDENVVRFLDYDHHDKIYRKY